MKLGFFEIAREIQGGSRRRLSRSVHDPSALEDGGPRLLAFHVRRVQVRVHLAWFSRAEAVGATRMSRGCIAARRE